MKKLMLAGVLVLALAVPAVAGAKQPPKKPPKTPKAQQVATKNAAWMCKTMKAANPVAFGALFGSNRNGRNAYGKCVSAHARAKNSNRAFSLRNITVAATGTVTNAGSAGCQFSASGCTLTSSGNLNGIAGGIENPGTQQNYAAKVRQSVDRLVRERWLTESDGKKIKPEAGSVPLSSSN